jgi:hypothetical protein
MLKSATIGSAVCVLATTLACSVSTPLTPAPSPANTFAKAPDGSNLKATAPKLVSPINNDTISNERPIFVIEPSDGQFAKIAFFYEFELTDDAGTVVRRDTSDTTQFQLPVTLGFDSPYRWRARAVLEPGIGPWSGQARFFTPKPPTLGRPTRNSSYDEWKVYFEQVRAARGIGPTVQTSAFAATRADLLAVDADWQNGWRGDMRARIFLPVPGCNGTAANNPSPPTCAFGRTVDVGNIGQTWQWVVRGQT